MTPTTFRAIRERAGYDIAGLAKWLGVTPRQVQRIEAGGRDASGPIVRLMTLLDEGRV